MVIDSSALLAILLNEPEADKFATILKKFKTENYCITNLFGNLHGS